jgi:hypothetical protein
VSGPASQLFKFAVDGVEFDSSIRFDLNAKTTGSGVDAALALFDEDGNALVKVDDDPDAAELGSEALEKVISSGRPYLVGIYFDPAGPPADFTLDWATAPQRANTPIVIDPGSGAAHLDADGGEDTFNTPADVDFYPLDFFNGASSGIVTVTPTGLDVAVFATLFRKGATGAWTPTAADADRGGGPVMLTATAPAGENLHDGEYLLGVAPLDYDTPARSYAIDVQTSSQLVPVDVSGEPIAHDFHTPLLSAFGAASESFAGSFAVGGSQVVAFRAPAQTTGTATLALERSGVSVYQPVLGVYDANGTSLIETAAREADGLVTLSLPVAAGQRFLVRVGDVGGNQGGAHSLKVTTPFNPQVVFANLLVSGASVTPVGNLAIGTDEGAVALRVVPPAGADVMALGLNTTGGSGVRVAVAGENHALSVHEVVAGQPLLLPVDLAARPGAIDVFVQGTTLGHDMATLLIGMLDVPTRLHLDDFQTAYVDAAGNWSATVPGGAFGTRGATKHYQVTTAAGESTTITAGALQSGALPTGLPLLARYRQHGSTQLDLVGYALPGAAAPAAMDVELTPDEVHGFVAMSLDFTTVDTLSLVLDGPEPLYVGVGMVPEPSLPHPPPSEPPNDDPFFSVLRIRDIAFEHDFEQHLWQTRLPYNMLNNAVPQVTLTSQPDGAFAPSFPATVTVMDQNLTVIKTATSAPNGPKLTINLDNISIEAFRGQSLLFKVEPPPNQLLNDGLYTLVMEVETDDPYPFLLTETAWWFHGTAPQVLSQDDSVVHTLPEVEPITDILQDQYGDGTHESQFTSSLPFDHNFPFFGAPQGNAGAIDVFRFWVETPGPVTVRTVPIDPMNGDPPVNTNIKLYKPRFNPDGTVSYLGQIPEVTLSMDWFPVDRSQIDAQTYVNDFDVLAFASSVNDMSRADYPYSRFTTTPETRSGGFYYVVVKNEQGTTGQYRIEVDAPSFPLLSGGGNPPIGSFAAAKNGQTTYLPQDDFNAVSLDFPYVEAISEFVGYFPIQFPDYHDGTFKVTPPFLALYDVDLFTAAGGDPLPKTITIDQSFPFSREISHFQVPLGPQTMYLRVQEILPNFNVNSLASLELKAEGSFPAGFVAPPMSPPTPVPVMLPSDPFGDGQASGSFVGAPLQRRAYSFKAAAGPLTVNVVPNDMSALSLRWAVYADGNLIAWDQTSTTQPDVAQTTTTALLPRFRGPLDTPDFDYDLASYHDVIVWVQSMSGQGGFTVSVDAASEMPMRTKRLVMNPLGSVASNVSTGTMTNVRGDDWIRLDVPDDASAVDVAVTLTEPGLTLGGPTSIRLEAYDAENNLLTSLTGSTSVTNPYLRTFTALAGVTPGNSYYLRVAAGSNSQWQMSVTASATLAKLSRTIIGTPIYGLPPSQRGLFGTPLFKPTISPDGEGSAAFGAQWDANLPNLVFAAGFWNNQPGVAEFTGKINTAHPVADKPYLALYKGNWVPQGENPYFINNYQLLLVDYTNGGNVDVQPSGNLYHLQARLEPGYYVLIAESNIASAGGTITIDLADYEAPQVVLDPNFGTSDLPAYFDTTDETTRDAFGNHFTPELSPLLPGFRNSYYQVVAPPGSQAAMLAVATNLPTDGNGHNPLNETARAHIWHKSESEVFELSANLNDFVNPPGDSQAQAISAVDAKPGQTFWMELHRTALDTKIGVGAQFVVPVSGNPELAVDTPVLSPNNGKTRVDVTVRNLGFAPASFFDRRFQFTDTSKNPDQTTFSDKLELPIGPLGSRSFVFDWLPVTPDDYVEYFADYDPDNPLTGPGDIPEQYELNNHGIEYLYTVDQYRPTVSLSLVDHGMDGTLNDPSVWGRYISGVYGATTNVRITGIDPDGDLYKAVGRHPYLDGTPSPDGDYYSSSLSGYEDTSMINFVDFGALTYTSWQNPNQFKMRAQDAFGLLSDQVIVTAQVEQFPGWLDNQQSELTFDMATHSYQIKFRNALLDWGPTTLDQLAYPSTVPFIGGLENRVLVEIKAQGVASLDPDEPVNFPVTARALVKVLGKNIFNETFTGQTTSNHFVLQSILQVDEGTLAADWMSVTFRLVDYPLYHWESPEITLFAYGVPEVASIEAYMQFLVDAFLNAAVTIAIDPSLINNPLQVPEILGLSTPTFIAPSIVPGLEIGGSVEFLGFDIASLSGSISFGFTPALGLPATVQGQKIPFDDFWDYACLGATGSLSGSIVAEVAEIDVYTFNLPTANFNFNPSCTVAESPAPSPTPQPPAGGPSNPLAGTTTFYGGDEPVGTLATDPTPKLVIDPATGEAMYVQLVDVDPGANVRNGLVFSRRVGGVWSPLAPIATAPATHVSNPVLAHTFDGPNEPMVMVYQAVNSAGELERMSRNEFLAGQNLRWRYFDGNAWGSESSLTTGSRYDFDHAVSFNAFGQGVVAWVENANGRPLADSTAPTPGALDRAANEIRVATWNAISHSWNPVTALTTNSLADGRPAVFADDQNTLYVLWLRDTPGGNEILYSTNSGSVWSSPRSLPVNGIVGGKFGGLAIGSESPGRIDVQFSHSARNSDGSVTSRLYNRPTTIAAFGAPAAAETIAEGPNFAHLRTIKAPDGGLVTYWQQSDGVVHDVFAARLDPASLTWSRPFRLSSGEMESTPSLAIDADGSYKLVYEDRSFVGAPSPQAGPIVAAAPPVGMPIAGSVGSTSTAPLPEFSFSRGISFSGTSTAAALATLASDAQVINRGPVGDDVLIEYLVGDQRESNVVASETMHLGPGGRFDVRYPFRVMSGDALYSIRLTALSGSEAFGDADNVTTTSLVGLPDLVVDAVELSNNHPIEGETILVRATVRNASGSNISRAFSVNYTQGDPDFTFAPSSIVPLGSQTINGLGPFADAQVTFPWTVPGGGVFALTVIADAGGATHEASEFNNRGQAIVVARADATVVDIVATELNYSGADNVHVTATIANLGAATLTDLVVRFQSSYDDLFIDEDGPLVTFQDFDSFVIPTLLPRQSLQVTSIASGLAGLNSYRVVVDQGLQQIDANGSNNVGETSLILQGLADLDVDIIGLDPDDGMSPSMPVQGAPLTVRTRISNRGILAARDFTVEVFARNSQVGNLRVGSALVSSLPPLQQIDVGVVIDTSQLLGPTDLLVIVDRHDKVLETNENNNQTVLKVDFKQRGDVRARKLFYRGSSFVTRDILGGFNHDTAIAPDKSALRPGESASFANYVSGPQGITGIIIDIENPNPLLSLSHFEFHVGNDDEPSRWARAPEPNHFLVRPREGIEETTRVEIGWRDGAIAQQWLEVTVLAAAASLLQDDVFYFGHTAGETGNLPDDFRVDGADVLLVEQNFAAAASIDNPFDFDRDGRVDAVDAALARNAMNAPFGDINRDDVVGLHDVARLQAALGMTEMVDYYGGDVTGDGRVSRADAASLAQSYGRVATAAMLAARLQPITIGPSPSPTQAIAAAVVIAVANPSSRPRRSIFHMANGGTADAALAVRERIVPIAARAIQVQVDGADTSLARPADTLSAIRQRIVGLRRQRQVIHDRIAFAAVDYALREWRDGDLG